MPTSLESADAIVVGAGHNGLVAANLLADAGWDVLVLEAAAGPGGAVRSSAPAPGFVSDLGSAFYPLGVASPVLRALTLERYGLRWRHAPDVLAHVFPDGRAAVLNRDPEQTAASVAEFAAPDADHWLTLYHQWRQLDDQMLAALFTPFPPVRPTARLLRRLGLGGALRLARRMLLPARRLGEELFEGEGARALLAGCTLHTDLTLEEPGGGLYGWLLTMLGQQYGFPVPEGGAGQLAQALARRALDRGVRLLYGLPVDRIAVARGRALGVRTRGGEWWRARQAVLADVPAPALYQQLVDPAQLPGRLVTDLARFRWDAATVKIDWALSGPVPWINPAAATAGTVHIGGTVADLSRYAAALARDEVPFEPFLVVGQLTTADPTRSPAGTESLWTYTHLPQSAVTAGAVERHIERIEATLEAYAPGLRALVVDRRISGPEELEGFNPNLVGGAIGGGTAALYQQLVFRPVPGLGRADTPVDRLYLASSSAHPGPGVHGGPGANAARAALARQRTVTGSLYRAGVSSAHRLIY
ncbi:MAG TPA: NAD(P)/FAD-dependent oxidoreductase [Natronosporangium sp.]|nr:NAD(P)/FAD-dependent oxidoreductase [Natronosporangium sp.]